MVITAVQVCQNRSFTSVGSVYMEGFNWTESINCACTVKLGKNVQTNCRQDTSKSVTAKAEDKDNFMQTLKIFIVNRSTPLSKHRFFLVNDTLINENEWYSKQISTENSLKIVYRQNYPENLTCEHRRGLRLLLQGVYKCY